MTKNKDLLALQRVNELCNDIYSALEKGDADIANSVAEERLSLLQNITFKSLLNDCPAEAHIAIDEFEKTNAQLISTSEEIKNTIMDELTKVKKSISAAKTYNEISKQ